MHPETLAVHQGVYVDKSYNSVTTPIYPSSTFSFDRLGEHRGFDYTRTGNPTRKALEDNLAALEGGVAAEITSTGMAAVTTAMFLLKAGDHVIAGNDIYGGTYRQFSSIMPNMGIEFSIIDMRDPQRVADAVRDNTRMIWIETPSNPLLNIVDIAAVCQIAKARDIITVCDNTFLSPLCQKPIDLGVDVVLHSTTKYINGHSDVVGGALIAAAPEMGERIKGLANALGTPCSPFDAFLVLRGVKTLPQRMEAHQRNAFALANWLREHDQVDKVYFTGFDDHPQKELIDRQQTGHGGMLAFEVRFDAGKLDDFFGAMQIMRLAESLGGIESLIEQPWSMSHASMGEQGLAGSGLTPRTVRLSTGIEHPDDLIEDLQRGFAAVK